MGTKYVDSLLRRLGDAVQELHIANEYGNQTRKRIASNRITKGISALKVQSVCVAIKVHRFRQTSETLECVESAELCVDSMNHNSKRAVLDVNLINDCSSTDKSHWRWQKGEIKISYLNKKEDTKRQHLGDSTFIPLDGARVSQEESDREFKKIFGGTRPRISELP